jgi:hypothetical protein
VHQLMDEVDAEAVTHEYASACRYYCAKLTSCTEQLRAGQDLSLDQMDEIEAAKLRLENAWTLCEFYVSRDIDPAQLPTSPSHPRLPA